MRRTGNGFQIQMFDKSSFFHRLVNDRLAAHTSGNMLQNAFVGLIPDGCSQEKANKEGNIQVRINGFVRR